MSKKNNTSQILRTRRDNLKVRDRGTGTGKWRWKDGKKTSYQRSAPASDGKTVYASGRNISEANSALRVRLVEYEEQLRISKASGNAPTKLRDFATWDIAIKLAQGVIRGSTAKKYRRCGRIQFDWVFAGRKLGDYQLSELTPVILEQVTAKAVSNLPAGEPCRTVLSFLKTLLNRAVELDILQRCPRGVKLPKKRYVSYPPPTTAEFLAVLTEAIKANDKPVIAFLVLVWHGMRFSEALGATFERIEGNKLQIDRQLVRVDESSQLVFAPLKSETSYRTLTLSDESMRLIYSAVELASEVEVEVVNEDGVIIGTTRATFLAPGRNGLPNPNHLRARIRKYAKTVGVERFKLHDLRSTALVDSVESGESIPAVAKVLGHTPEVAMQSYMRVRPESIAKASLARSQMLTDALRL